MSVVFSHVLTDCRVGLSCTVSLPTPEGEVIADTTKVQRAVWWVDITSGKCVLAEFTTNHGHYVRQNPILIEVYEPLR